jgi:hypothetical protein
LLDVFAGVNQQERCRHVPATPVGSPVGWTPVVARQGFLAIDRNFDGAITSGRELFGTATLLGWGIEGTPGRHGFEALGGSINRLWEATAMARLAPTMLSARRYACGSTLTTTA